MSFNALDLESCLQVLSFVNAQGLARMASSSWLGAVASHEAQQQPYVLVLKGTPDEVAKEIRERLASRPTAAFLQYCQRDNIQEICKFIRNQLPPQIEMLAAFTDSLPYALFRGDLGPSTALETCDPRIGSDQIGLFLATLPEAAAHSLHIPPSGGNENTYGDSSDEYDSDDSGGEDHEEECEEDVEPDEGGRDLLAQWLEDVEDWHMVPAAEAATSGEEVVVEEAANRNWLENLGVGAAGAEPRLGS
jgi:lysophospholipase L1-like esterase